MQIVHIGVALLTRSRSFSDGRRQHVVYFESGHRVTYCDGAVKGECVGSYSGPLLFYH